MLSLSATGPVVGVFPDAKFSVKEILFEKKRPPFAFTDGIPDARSSEDNSFGHQRLRDLLNNDDLAPDALLKNIEEQLLQFTNKTSQFDDITLLAVKGTSDSSAFFGAKWNEKYPGIASFKIPAICREAKFIQVVGFWHSP